MRRRLRCKLWTWRLDLAVLKVRIDLRVCELKLLAAWTAVNWGGRVERGTAVAPMVARFSARQQQPAIFLKMLVLLVPREMEISHSSTIKQMTDEQIEAAIEAIQAMLARAQAGANAKVIEAKPAEEASFSATNP